jgi:hypothetical protein
MSGEAHSRHCLWLMLAVRLSHNISGVATRHIRTVLSQLALGNSCPSGLNATPITSAVWPGDPLTIGAHEQRRPDAQPANPPRRSAAGRGSASTLRNQGYPPRP